MTWETNIFTLDSAHHGRGTQGLPSRVTANQMLAPVASSGFIILYAEKVSVLFLGSSSHWLEQDSLNKTLRNGIAKFT